MQKKSVDNLENVIPFDAETREIKVENAQNDPELPYEGLDRLVSQYYYAKSLEQDTASLEFAQDLEKSSEELAFSILTTRAAEPRQVLLKLNILENELATELENGAPFDGKYLVMFAGLKADLIRVVAQVETL
jgi:hypothetical protein